MRHGRTIAQYRSAFERYVAAVGDGEVNSCRPGEVSGPTVADVMTSQVLAVPGSTAFKQLVETIAGARVDAVPVVDEDGRVVGIVSTSDLFAKVVGTQVAVADFHGDDRKALGETAAEVMTRNPVVTHPHVSAKDAARLAAKHRIRRLPVTDEDGRLVGIVTRSDLLRIFLREDTEIRAYIIDNVLLVSGIPLSAIDVDVRDGVVTLTGRVTESVARVVRAVPGVVAVHCAVQDERPDSADRRTL